MSANPTVSRPPATTRRVSLQNRRDMRRRHYVLFLGGPFSGILTAIAVARPDLRTVPWFCLVPLIFSLERHASRPLLRLSHGLGFGLILCAAELSWVFPILASGRPAGLWNQFLASAEAAGVWGSYCAWWSIFCLASGPVFRRENPLARLLLLPLLWSGLEIARGALDSPWVSPWLSAGTLLSAPLAESQAAAVVGVFGLSFALVLSATAISGLLHDHRPWRQLGWALAACAAPAACFGYGFRAWEPPEPSEPVTVMVVSHEDEKLETLSKLSLGLASTLPTWVLWPYLPVEVDKANHTLEVPAEIRALADALSGVVIGGTPPSLQPGIPLAIDRVGRRLPAQPDDAPEAVESASSLQIFEARESRGGLGLGFEFHTPSTARVLTQNGAEFLLGSAGMRASWPSWVLEREARLLAFRAIENRRWLAVSASAWGAVYAPDGSATFRILGGVEGAGTETLAAIETLSPYARWGWWLEPAALLATLWLILSTVWQRQSSPAGGPELEHR